MKEIAQNLYQFSIYIPPMDFTIHQYLLVSEPAILFAAGTVGQAEKIIPQIKDILGEKPLDYVFISHMESDEAGGIFAIQKCYPDVKVICSEITARELPGYGYKGEIIMKKGDSTLQDGNLELVFADYPSEVHLQDGIVCMEKNTGIMYSADLFLRFGNDVGNMIDGLWSDEVHNINEERVPDSKKCDQLKAKLATWSPNVIAVGHGYCVNCK